MLNPEYDFSWMIAPVTTEEFFSQYWERRPLHIPRQEPEYYLPLGSLKELDYHLSPIEIGHSFAQLVEPKESRGLKPNLSPLPTARGLRLFEELYEGYREGNTIKWHRFDRRVRKLSLFCRRLGVHLGVDAGIDLYLTPKDSPSYDAHYDRYEFFVLQLEGRKHWRVYDTPVGLPRSGANTFYAREIGNVLLDIELKPGDMLYMPRGYYHETWTSPDSLSLSMSLGMQVYTWFQALMAAFEAVEEKDIRFRQALPIGFTEREQPLPATKEQFKQLLEVLLDEANLNTGLNRLTERFYRFLHVPTEGFLSELQEVDQLDLRTTVKKRVDGPYRLIVNVDADDETLTLMRPGWTIKLPKEVEGAVRFILEADHFQIGSLPDNLTHNSKLVLVRRLLKEGFLATVKEA